MKLRTLLLASAFALSWSFGWAQHYVLSTNKTSLGVTANQGGKAYIQYYGQKITQADLSEIFKLKSNFTSESYPTFGLNTAGEKAITVQMPDGNMSLEMTMQKVEQTSDKNGQILALTFKDKVYPFQIKQFFKAYNGTDIISTWTEISNQGKKAVKMLRMFSADVPLQNTDNNYVCHYHGAWASENYVEQTKLTPGEFILNDKEGLRNGWGSNPTLMVSINGIPEEESGEVFGGALVWSGNFKIAVTKDNSRMNVFAGINDENSSYKLDGGETFTTPEFAMTYSNEGKGGVSRAFHRWARKYVLRHGDQQRDILLNSWEGVYMDVNEPVMDKMMGDIADLGGELFVMDDGWFGDKYPRTTSQGLGDWMVNKTKLPHGIGWLTAAAKKHGIKFGIWIEPEMANTKSELAEKHPNWIMRCKDRTLSTGRGGTQVVLDLTNPEVQDFVFNVTDKLMTENPDIAYIKWDCNSPLRDWGSTYLSADRQSELNIRYHMGLRKVLEKINKKYPNLVIQCCASGGGRISYGFMPYFDEYWDSDDTDAYQRVFIQWGTGQFYPAIAQASHVSASPNHQTGREVPLKFRFDVAMTGRLGMEMQPSKMTPEELSFSKRSIAAYKSIRPVVQMGDIYRLLSPYDYKSTTALMFSSEDKSHCAFFAYNMNYLHNMLVPSIRLTGVDENKNYRIKDLTPWDEKKPCFLDGKVVSGRTLKYSGIMVNSLFAKHQLGSVALELVAE